MNNAGSPAARDGQQREKGWRGQRSKLVHSLYAVKGDIQNPRARALTLRSQRSFSLSPVEDSAQPHATRNTAKRETETYLRHSAQETGTRPGLFLCLGGSEALFESGELLSVFLTGGMWLDLD